MPIDKIGSVEYYSAIQRNTIKSRPVLRSAPQDSITLTKAAQQNAELLRVRKLVMAAPDMRPERISELRGKLRQPAYPGQQAIAGLVDRLLQQWGV